MALGQKERAPRARAHNRSDAWGARYHTSPVQLLCLLAVPLFLEIAPGLKVFARRAIQTLIGLACFFQLCSIVFWYTVEIIQFNCNAGTNFRISQRIDNIILYFTGNFQPPPNCQGLENANILPFWPFYAAVDVIPRPLLPLTAAFWFILLLITGWALIRFMRKAFRQLTKDQALLPAARLNEDFAGESI